MIYLFKDNVVLKSVTTRWTSRMRFRLRPMLQSFARFDILAAGTAGGFMMPPGMLNRIVRYQCLSWNVALNEESLTVATTSSLMKGREQNGHSGWLSRCSRNIFPRIGCSQRGQSIVLLGCFWTVCCGEDVRAGQSGDRPKSKQGISLRENLECLQTFFYTVYSSSQTWSSDTRVGAWGGKQADYFRILIYIFPTHLNARFRSTMLFNSRS